MGQISETYASPGLRRGLLYEDHPGAVISHEYVADRNNLPDGIDVSMLPPPQYGGDGAFCVAKIDFGPGSDRSPAYGVKSVPPTGNADQWTVLCTKTTGRALKAAGYPDDTIDLKALVAWRARNSDIAVGTGTLTVGGAIPATTGVRPALGAGDPDPDPVAAAIDEAGRSNATRPPSDDDEVVAEVVADDDDRIADARELIEGLVGADLKNFKGYLKTIGAPEDPAAMTPSQIEDVLNWLDPTRSAD